MRLVKQNLVMYSIIVSAVFISVTLFWRGDYRFTNLLCINFQGFGETDNEIINQTIYFLETSGKSKLSHRQVAAVESAARFVSHSHILVLIFTKDNVTFTPAMKDLSSTFNVQFLKAEILSVLKDTPLEQWYNSGLVEKSEHFVVHTSDALRLALLWKNGGIYMDLDIIMFRKYRVTKSSVYWEANTKYLGNCMMAFGKGHVLLETYMEEFNENYSPGSYAGNGPWLFTDVYMEYKNSLKVLDRDCGIDEVHPHFFSSLNFNETSIYFDELANDRVLLARTKETFGHHMWNFQTKNLKVRPKSQCAYMQLVRRNCPIVYREMLLSEYV